MRRGGGWQGGGWQGGSGRDEVAGGSGREEGGRERVAEGRY